MLDVMHALESLSSPSDVLARERAYERVRRLAGR
jgi:hypothetical protein